MFKSMSYDILKDFQNGKGLMELEIINDSQIQNINKFTIAIEKATEIIQQSNSINSKRAFKGDMSYWQAWYNANGISIIDVRKEHIILFIMQHLEYMPEELDDVLVFQGVKSKHGLHKVSTVERRLNSLSCYLQILKKENPCKDKDVSILLSRLKQKHGCSKSWGGAITLDVLNDLLNTCQNDGLFGIRDSAILLFGFSTGGRRRSEISNAMLQDLTRNSDGSYIYNMGKSKTNQSGQSDPKPILGRAAMALTHWITVANITDGPIFIGIKKGGKNTIRKGLSDKQISRIIKKRCEKAGYEYSEFTAHSIRSGFVTEGGKRNKQIGDIMALTGHKNIETVMRYYKSGAVINNSAAYLAG